MMVTKALAAKLVSVAARWWSFSEPTTVFPSKIARRLTTVAVDPVRFARSPRRRRLVPNVGGTAAVRRYGDGGGPDKYKVFRDDDSSVILDVEEERALLRERLSLEHDVAEHEVADDRFADFNTSRGVSGVFEIEDLVQVLEKNKASNIFVVSVPTNIRYVDYIVIASGRSQKHLMSIAEFVHKLFKVKCNPTDSIPRILNKKPLDWIALDIGNIALHLLTKDTRNNFDLETIWSVGEKYDSHLNRPTDSLVMLLNEHSFSLNNLVPDDIDNVKM